MKKIVNLLKTYNDSVRESFERFEKEIYLKHLEHKYIVFVLPVAILFVFILAFLMLASSQAGQFSLSEVTIKGSNNSLSVSSDNFDTPSSLMEEADIKLASSNKTPSGVLTVAVNIKMINRELNRPAGWVVNDKVFPTMFLDNNRNFQMGVREVYLRTVQMLRENLSRQDRTNSPINEDIDKAYGYISVRAQSWIFPSYESQLVNSTKSLKKYSDKLYTGKAGFYPRADTLVKVLENYASILGSVSTKLTEKNIKWSNQDDRFYFAKGVVYAMYENLLAIQVDFNEALSKNNGIEIMNSIVEDMKTSYFEPNFVLTGDVDSFINNHLDRISRKILSSRQKMNSLSSVLLHRGSPSGG